MRFLIYFGTTDGQTAKIANSMAATLRSTGATVEVANAAAHADPNPADFDAVIVAASVHAGSYQHAVVRWVERHHAALSARPNVFVSVCLAIVNRTPKVDEDIRQMMQRFFAMSEWQPRETKVVAGALLYRNYNWLKRWMMRRIVARQGGETDTSRNHEYTDWRDLEEFTKRFAASVSAQQESSHAAAIGPRNTVRANARAPR